MIGPFFLAAVTRGGVLVAPIVNSLGDARLLRTPYETPG